MDDAVVEEPTLKPLAGVVRALVRMMRRRGGLAASSDRHQWRIHDQRGIAIRVHGSADDASGQQVWHDREI
jgi:hypothetical protein